MYSSRKYLRKTRLIHVIGELPGIGINVTALFGRKPLKQH
jgi:hypothetical protein